MPGDSGKLRLLPNVDLLCEVELFEESGWYW